MTDDDRYLDARHAGTYLPSSPNSVLVPDAFANELDLPAHCLDSLRQSVQCAGDVSLLTMKWGVHIREPVANFTSPHECVNWDNIQDWASERVYDVMAPGVLVHPTLGPSYPDGKPGLGVGRDQ